MREIVDRNWYMGECNDKRGFVPSSYVELLTSPEKTPHGIALYDFDVCAAATKSQTSSRCLSFVKGAYLQIFRRVDQNWAEGKLADKEGIFPIAFVQLNETAASLLQFESKPGSSSNFSSLRRPSSAKKLKARSSINPALHNGWTVSSIPKNVIKYTSHARPNSSVISSAEQLPLTIPADTGLPASYTSNKVATNSKALVYVAKFSYTPRKGDELALTKGSLYAVIERCHDGWFKGRCLSSHSTGVFPGNYLEPAKSQVIADYMVRRHSGSTQSNNSPLHSASSIAAAGRSTSVDASGSTVPLRYRCTAQYPGLSSEELSINVGDIVVGLPKPSSSEAILEGWSFGECRGRKGFFPASFVRPL